MARIITLNLRIARAGEEAQPAAAGAPRRQKTGRTEVRPYTRGKEIAGKGAGRYRLARDGFGEMGLARGDAAVEEAAGGEEFGVEQGGAGGAAD